MSLSSGAALGPYAILAELGHGGMGVVYTAQDPRLDRQVAIKVLTADLTRDATAKRRFLQEAKAASALDHPNICTIHEINETDDGQLYLVMAYYEGETLKQRIEQGPLALDKAVDIATQVGLGLSKAHAAGIVHRDIKPANLIVSADGTVKLLDFGLAKLAGTEGVTQTGTTVGTVAYMSPEQARGQNVDHRTDIWSLGVVLYEMLTGQQPFQGENLLAISNAILESEPVSLTRLRAGASPALARVVTRSLANSRAGRYQSVADLLTELRTVKDLHQAPTATTAVSQSNVPSIAVLPFADMSPKKDQDYFCDGMAEELINALAGLDGLHVAARTSSFKFRGEALDATEIGTQLKVGSILEGSVRKAGNRLRITAQLINVSDGFHLWSERYDRDMDDVFAVQDDIAHAVVEKLKVRLLGVPDAPLVKRATDDLEAYTLYLQGRHYFTRFSGPAFEKGLKCFSQAVALKPAYAQAHAGIAQVQACRAVLSFGVAPHTVMPGANESALKTLAIDETMADAHTALALILDYYEWKRLEAEREYRRALELNPGDTIARGSLAQLLGKQGRAEGSIAEARSAVERDPLSLIGRFALASMFLYARQFDRAIAEVQAGIELDPNFHLSYVGLGQGLAGLGRYDEAVEALRRATVVGRRSPHFRLRSPRLVA